MATSDHRQTVAEPRADEDWVFLHHDGDGQRDGDAKRNEESVWGAAERPKSAQATETVMELHPSAGTEDSICSLDFDFAGLRGFLDRFPLLPALHAFPGVCEPSLVDENPARMLWTCLKRLTRIVLRAAVFSCAARFLFWSAAKASVVKRPEMLQLLLVLAVMNLGTPLAHLATWYSELIANMVEMVYHDCWPRRKLMRYAAFTNTVPVLTHMATFLLLMPIDGICTDVEATWRILLLRFREVYATQFDGIGETVRECLAEGYPPAG
ncbi:uncharacterized protein [Dermacentor andersoni]|uniref:uncharacterized protein n=1 Tax=Dermacentor andersoni TaxID=34620 RepID=UPI0024172345|nr:uncharacterized protein LOC129385238 [Dermacentor andersoni]